MKSYVYCLQRVKYLFLFFILVYFYFLYLFIFIFYTCLFFTLVYFYFLYLFIFIFYTCIFLFFISVYFLYLFILFFILVYFYTYFFLYTYFFYTCLFYRREWRTSRIHFEVKEIIFCWTIIYWPSFGFAKYEALSRQKFIKIELLCENQVSTIRILTLLNNELETKYYVW